MKFVFLSYNYSPDINSPEAWIKRIDFYVGSLESLKKTNTVIRVDQINYAGNFIHEGIQYYCIKPTKRKNYFPVKLHRFVKNLNPDIVVVSSFNFPLQVIQLRIALGKKVKIIIQNHAEKPYTGIKRYLQRIADNCIDAYFFAAFDAGAEWVSKRNIASGKKIHEIMEVSSVFYPVDKQFARLKTGIQGNPVFLWVGRLNKNKDPLTVVNAFLKFATIQPDAKLYLVYQTTELLNDVKKLILENKSTSHSIILVGLINHAEMLYWYNSADFIISSSHYEGSGTVICEAMSCGCVPIVTSIPSFKIMTANGDSGLLYEAGNKNELLSALMKTTTLDVQIKKAKVLARFKNQLSFEAIASKIEEVAVSLITIK